MRLYLNGQIWDHHALPTSRRKSLRDEAGSSRSHEGLASVFTTWVVSLNPAPRILQETLMRRLAPSPTVLLLLGASVSAATAGGADDLVPPGAGLERLYTRTAPIRGGL